MTTILILFFVIGLIGTIGAVNNLQHSESPPSVSDEPHHNAVFYRCCAVHMSIVAMIALAALAGVLRFQPWSMGTCILLSLHGCGAAYLITRAVLNGMKAKRMLRFRTKTPMNLHPMLARR